MGTYFNPPSALSEVARKLEAPSIFPIEKGSYEALTSQLQEGEELFGLYDRGMFMNAVHLYSPDELEAFEDQYRRGIIVRLGFYALPKEEFDKI